MENLLRKAFYGVLLNFSNKDYLAKEVSKSKINGPISSPHIFTTKQSWSIYFKIIYIFRSIHRPLSTWRPFLQIFILANVKTHWEKFRYKPT